MGVDCIYLESRVGKVPGIRAKKTQAVVGAEPSKRQRQMSSSATTRDTSSPSSSGAPADKDKELDQRDAEDTIWWSPESSMTVLLSLSKKAERHCCGQAGSNHI
ncbi:hypothetical protein F4824DRAFT_142695 [Ustulina deusta]|nr:hypothetical protein F4824DRAFT_142695 [Ustulina deusta]